MDLSLLWYALATLLIAAGLAGTLYPALPGLGLVAGGMLLAAATGDFQHVGVWSLSIIAVLALGGMLLDSLAGVLGARRSGASRQALWGALAGAITGLAFGLAGAIIGPVIGAIAGEWLARRDLLQAGRVGIATFIGFLIGSVAKIACAFAMLTVFAIAWLLS